MNNPGVLVVLSGPSGVGKDTLLRQLEKVRTSLFYSVSATTRPARPGEEDGKSYFFLSDEEFERLIREDKLLEYARYNGHYYGTPRSAVFERLRQGKDVILKIEVRGAAQVKKRCPEAVLIFVMPPSLRSLEKRLRGRGTEDEAEIENRLAIAREEMRLADDYDYIVINGELKKAAGDVDAIIRAEGLRVPQNRQLIQEVLHNAEAVGQ